MSESVLDMSMSLDGCALVVIPTNSPQNHSKSNSALIASLGDQGSQVRVLSPRRPRKSV
jgi:hypothetical protein